MRIYHGLWAVVALAIGGAAFGQTPATQDADARMERFEQRLTQLEKKYQADLKARDEEIARLKAQLDRQGAPATGRADEIERTKQDSLRQIEGQAPVTTTVRTPANFNPDIAVIGNFIGNISSNGKNPARDRFSFAELELELRAAVDPRADAVVALPFTRDVDNPLFFDPAAASGDINTSFDIEEAYLSLHDFGVNNLTAKLGRFHLRFGRQNLLHDHDFPTVDTNFVAQSFLGSEAIVGDGLSLSYVIPPKLIANHYVELVTEIISGEGPDQPVLNNDAFLHSPAINQHLLWNHDIASDWNLELGASFLWGKHNDDFHQNAFLYGIDATLLHTDSTGGFNNQLFQLEAIHGDVDSARGARQHSNGAYLLAQQQWNRDWYAGMRLDWTQNALNDRQDVWGVSPYVTWYWSEFLRFRLEYQHKQGDTPHEDTLYFQATWVFGAHPPHPYWALK